MAERTLDQQDKTFVPQDRFKWYQVNNFLQYLSQVATELSLRPEDLVQIGGTALFYRCYQVFGPEILTHFRGTFDMDVMSFRKGMVPLLMDRIVNLPHSPAKGYEIRESHGIQNKESMTVNLKPTNLPHSIRNFEIDLYEAAFGVIRFNDREFREDKVIVDPVEEIKLPVHRGLVAAPSIRDSFIIKMDIVDYSNTGLRPKDRLDVLTTLRLLLQQGGDFDYLLDALIATSDFDSSRRKLDELEDLFSNPLKDLAISEDSPFLPDGKDLMSAAKDVRRYRDYELYK